MKKYILQHGGATVINNKPINEAPINTPWCVGVKNLYTGDINGYDFNQAPANYGAWIDNNTLYIDMIELHNEQDALRIAKQNGELAIYNLNTKETKNV